ncbi:MAG: hypothetical protein QM530_06615 [Phycisphaerales bacterium]|nr:hypothetical protein [Phycisphaerales bacterium]
MKTKSYSILRYSALVLATTLLLTACNKFKTALLSTKDHISGSWKLAQQGSDVNKNAHFDVDEKNLVSDSAIVTFQFKVDGSGFRVGANNVSVDTLSWDLFFNESSLHIAITDRGFVNNQYFKFEYTNSTLLLCDTTVAPHYFRLYQRQD